MAARSVLVAWALVTALRYPGALAAEPSVIEPGVARARAEREIQPPAALTGIAVEYPAEALRARAFYIKTTATL